MEAKVGWWDGVVIDWERTSGDNKAKRERASLLELGISSCAQHGKEEVEGDDRRLFGQSSSTHWPA